MPNSINYMIPTLFLKMQKYIGKRQTADFIGNLQKCQQWYLLVVILQVTYFSSVFYVVQFLNNNYVLNFLSEKKPNIFLFIYLATLCGLWDLSFSIRDEPRPLAVKSAEPGPLGTSPKSSILKCALHKLFKSFSKFF